MDVAGWFRRRTWSPYVSGGLTGVLLALSVLVTGKFLGASTSFVRVSGMIEKLFWPERVAHMPYLLKKTPTVDWQVMMVLGIFVGALLSAWLSRDLKVTLVPSLWESRFEYTPFKRVLVAFVGGVIALFGARMAGGCPSGHGLSGVGQLSMGSLLAMAGFLVGGILTARGIYARRY